MTDCIEERESKHYRAPWFGFGIVRDNERVVFAVFDRTPLSGSALKENSFDGNKLKKNNQSLARDLFVTKRIFDRKIVRRDESNNGAFLGIVWASVSKIREIRADVKLNAGTVKVRAICVLDRVEAGDCDGHATMGYEETEALGLSKEQLGKVRKRIRYDLANAFSNVTDAKEFLWPGAWNILLVRCEVIKGIFREKVSGKRHSKA
jgi:hypothetical protein